MTIPAEVRLKILRMLLNRGETIPSLHRYFEYTTHTYSYPHEERYHSEVLSLSSQLLACCQTLLAEGSAVLYRENTVSVEIYTFVPERLGSSPYPCFSTTLDIAFSATNPAYSNTRSRWMSNAFRFCKEDSQSSGIAVTDRYSILLPRFKNFEVRIRKLRDKPMALFEECLSFQSLLGGKNVQLYIDDEDLLTSLDKTWGFAQCQVLRCAKFEIHQNTEVDTFAVVQHVQSTTPVDDIWRCFCKFEYKFLLILDQGLRASFIEKHTQQYAEARRLVCTDEKPERVREILTNLMKAAEPLIKADEVSRIIEIHDRYQNAIEEAKTEYASAIEYAEDDKDESLETVDELTEMHKETVQSIRKSLRTLSPSK